MLVLTRKAGETIVIGDGVVVTVLDTHAGRVRLGFEGPADVPVMRGELVERGVRSLANHVPRRRHPAQPGGGDQ